MKLTGESDIERRVRSILRDLYRADPSLKGREAELKKVIRDLLEAKPEASMDEAFERELKDRLLASFSTGKRRRPAGFAAVWAKPGFRAAIGLATAAGLALIVNSRIAIGEKYAPPRAAVAEPGKAPGSGDTADQVALKDEKPADGPAAAKAKSSPEPSLTQGRSAGDRIVGGSAPGLAGLAPVTSAQATAPSSVDDSGLFAIRGAAERKKAELGSEAYMDLVYEEAEADRDVEAPGFPRVAAKPAAKPAPEAFNTEAYDRVVENAWNDPVKEPLSTFSIDVDTASYANVRRFLSSGNLPPPDAVRIEELVNYFAYDYREPEDGEPLAFDTELTDCPWLEGHYLVRVGVQAKRIPAAELPPTNLVFLIDVSGSMEEPNKLPLVKESLKLLAGKMRQQDRVSIVVYSGAAGLVLEPTPGGRERAVRDAIDRLEAGGSTAGGEGIELAYAVAQKAFIKGGNNRVVLATDGDFNVGASSDGAMVRLIEEKRKGGVFLTVLGFGMGNYKDSKMQKLADSGNGNYAYIDTLEEAVKVLDRQMAGTLYTLAKDVKIQIEFNPATVASYRLIGYEKRVLAARDFDDDAKDAGELGAGHSVTALYEIVPASGTAATRTDLRYQSATTTPAASGGDLMTIKFRYKKPDGAVSKLVERAVPWKPAPLAQASRDTRFAAAVAAWGSLLRKSEYAGAATWSMVEDLAIGAKGKDADGYRAEFIGLVRESRRLAEGR